MPPGQLYEDDEIMYRILFRTLLSSDVLILGDFNVPHIDRLTLMGCEGNHIGC